MRRLVSTLAWQYLLGVVAATLAGAAGAATLRWSVVRPLLMAVLPGALLLGTLVGWVRGGRSGDAPAPTGRLRGWRGPRRLAGAAVGALVSTNIVLALMLLALWALELTAAQSDHAMDAAGVAGLVAMLAGAAGGAVAGGR